MPKSELAGIVNRKIWRKGDFKNVVSIERSEGIKGLLANVQWVIDNYGNVELRGSTSTAYIVRSTTVNQDFAEPSKEMERLMDSRVKAALEFVADMPSETVKEVTMAAHVFFDKLLEPAPARSSTSGDGEPAAKRVKQQPSSAELSALAAQAEEAAQAAQAALKAVKTVMESVETSFQQALKATAKATYAAAQAYQVASAARMATVTQAAPPPADPARRRKASAAPAAPAPASPAEIAAAAARSALAPAVTQMLRRRASSAAPAGPAPQAGPIPTATAPVVAPDAN